MQHYRNIEIVPQHDGLLLWLNNPTKRNAISTKVIGELTHFFSQSFDNYQFIIIAGRGDCFAAGADLSEMVSVSESEAVQISRSLHQLLEQMGRVSIPVIAAVHGYAIGGGFELALGADMVFAAQSAWFNLPEIGFSLIPGGGATQKWTNIVGRRSAFFHMLTSARISADEALNVGFVQKIFPDEQFFDSVTNFVSSIFKPLTQQAVVALKNAVRAAGQSDGYTVEANAFSQLLANDAKPLIQKFLDRK